MKSIDDIQTLVIEDYDEGLFGKSREKKIQELLVDDQKILSFEQISNAKRFVLESYGRTEEDALAELNISEEARINFKEILEPFTELEKDIKISSPNKEKLDKEKLEFEKNHYIVEEVRMVSRGFIFIIPAVYRFKLSRLLHLKVTYETKYKVKAIIGDGIEIIKRIMGNEPFDETKRDEINAFLTEVGLITTGDEVKNCKCGYPFGKVVIEKNMQQSPGNVSLFKPLLVFEDVSGASFMFNYLCPYCGKKVAEFRELTY